MKYLSVEEILRLHFQVIEDYGGSHGVRDETRIASVIKAPKQFAFGKEQYSSVYEKAAVYMRNIILDHPFTDGNKRTGVITGAIFLTRNGIELHAAPDDLADFAVRIATDSLDVPAIAMWLDAHTK